VIVNTMLGRRRGFRQIMLFLRLPDSTPLQTAIAITPAVVVRAIDNKIVRLSNAAPILVTLYLRLTYRLVNINLFNNLFR
jgi:hypothetical protein